MGQIRKALKAIYQERKDLGGITQDAIAEHLGCDQSTVSLYLKGKRGMSDDVIEGFCEFFGVKFADLETWNPELAKIRFAAVIDGATTPVEHADLHRKLAAILEKSQRSETILKAVIDLAYKEVRKKL